MPMYEVMSGAEADCCVASAWGFELHGPRVAEAGWSAKRREHPLRPALSTSRAKDVEWGRQRRRRCRMQKTKRQHTVPRCYLERFANPTTGNISTFDKLTK